MAIIVDWSLVATVAELGSSKAGRTLQPGVIDGQDPKMRKLHRQVAPAVEDLARPPGPLAKDPSEKKTLG